MNMTFCTDGFVAEINPHNDAEFEAMCEYLFGERPVVEEEDEGDDIHACMMESLGNNWW